VVTRAVATAALRLQPDVVMASKNEPQSYGSQSEWVRGDTGGTVNAGTSAAPAETSEAHGGIPSGVDEDRGSGSGTVVDEQPVKKVTSLPTGAVTRSYFKKRDYE
jgi:hypothetical protein